MISSSHSVSYSIAERIDSIRARISLAAQRAGRDPSSIQLVAVSKTHPVEAIEEAYAAGIRDFGENYAQEYSEKHKNLAHLKDIRWHFVGNLQTNKVRLVAPTISLIHCVDSAKLIRELARRSVERTSPLPVLIEVNIGQEQTKGGISPHELDSMISYVESEKTLELKGLMAIPPPQKIHEHTRYFHRELYQLREQYGGPSRLPILSMGMTDDFEIAIEEGSTLIRIGTAIFGTRQKRV